MRNSKLLIILLVFISLLYGCNEGVKSQVDFKLLTNEKTLPTNFDDIAFKRDMTPLFEYLVRKSVNKSELDQTWKLYGLEQEIPEVDFNESVVYFIGFRWGGCPIEIKEITFNSENNNLRVPLSVPDGTNACTSKGSPKTIVIQIEKEQSDKVKKVTIVQSDTETTVPFE